ncbi:hydrolase [Legionella lytica]|uniref:Hydrolase n=1 Tax=Legionella lytica TaxID=96232 RepID=A0ABW8D2W8_9GAMM
MLLNKEESLLLLIDVQEKLTPAVINSEALIAQCEWLLKLARKLSVPVLVSEQYPKGLGTTVSPLQEYYDSQECIDKVHFSCMSDANYTQRLHQLHKKQLVLIGMETHVCVLQTALEMKEQGFEVFVVVDAVSSRGAQNIKYGLKRMQQAGVQLVTSEMVFFEWIRKAGTPEFKELSKEFLA